MTGSFDNTIACWEWSTGSKIQQFRGHTGAGGWKALLESSPLTVRTFIFLRCLYAVAVLYAFKFSYINCSVVAVFSIDYNDELDTLVSGSADFTVKVWSLSAGTCVNTFTGHTEWVTKVRLYDYIEIL